MKLILLSIIFCFGSLIVHADPNLIEKGYFTEAGVADTSRAHQNAQRSFGTVPSATCPSCAYAQTLDPNLPPGDRGANYDYTTTDNGNASKKDDGVK
jgi:hypothetical protein